MQNGYAWVEFSYRNSTTRRAVSAQPNLQQIPTGGAYAKRVSAAFRETVSFEGAAGPSDKPSQQTERAT
jgi:hypothetical protein